MPVGRRPVVKGSLGVAAIAALLSELRSRAVGGEQVLAVTGGLWREAA